MKTQLTITLLEIAALGAGATAIMDLWGLLQKRLLNMSSLSYCLVGRWLGHIPAGQLRHAAIGAAAPVKYECVIGWGAHYAIGVLFAGLFILIAGTRWLQSPTLLPALLFGLASVLAPFFVMQPALGAEIAASKTPKPTAARLRSLATHLVFGAGLYLAGLFIRLLG